MQAVIFPERHDGPPSNRHKQPYKILETSAYINKVVLVSCEHKSTIQNALGNSFDTLLTATIRLRYISHPIPLIPIARDPSIIPSFHHSCKSSCSPLSLSPSSRRFANSTRSVESVFCESPGKRLLRTDLLRTNERVYSDGNSAVDIFS